MSRPAQKKHKKHQSQESQANISLKTFCVKNRMVKKFMYQLSGLYTSTGMENNGELEMLLDFNNDLHNLLKLQKDLISEHYKTKKWDKYKKCANEYELIFTSGYGHPSLSKHNPISRSYFKLWEILTDFKIELGMDFPEYKRCAFLAEGPGGFIEAFTNFRSSYENDELFGITLLSPDKNIPSWKLPTDITNVKRIKLLKGLDGSGSLYNVDNIESFINVIGQGSCDLVTADGGFDFSNDFNNQEEMSTLLVISEMYTALQLQKQNGNMVLKIYDIHSYLTVQLLYILKMFYNTITFCKPLSSRPANSEKYIICIKFCGHEHNMYDNVCSQLKQSIVNQCFDLDIKVPITFMYDIIEYNAFYILKQIIHINKTLCFINIQNAEDANNIRHQLTRAIKWCNKYNIVVNLEALASYCKVLHK